MDNKITQVTMRVINELYHNGDPDKALLIKVLKRFGHLFFKR